MRRGARAKLMGFTLLPIIAIACALSASTASAHVGKAEGQFDHCKALHVVVVKGAVTASASGSLTANVQIVREERFDPGRMGLHNFNCASLLTANPSSTSTTSSTSPSQSRMGTLTFSTSSSTVMSGTFSSPGTISVGDEIVAAFIVPRHRALSANANLTAVRLMDLGASTDMKAGIVAGK